jgi:hypothetical protein
MFVNVTWVIEGLAEVPVYAFEAESLQDINTKIFQKTRLLPREQSITMGHEQFNQHKFEELPPDAQIDLIVKKKRISHMLMNSVEFLTAQIKKLETKVARLEHRRKKGGN